MASKSDLDSGLVIVEQVLPIRLPIIPLHLRPVFPGMLTPVMIDGKKLIGTVDYALDHDGYIGLVLTKKSEEEVSKGELYQIGTVAKIIKKINLPDGSVNIFINSIKRFKIRKIISKNPIIQAAVNYESLEKVKEDDETKALIRTIFSEIKEISENNPLFTEEIRLSLVNLKSPSKLADFIASILNISRGEQQMILEEMNIKTRILNVLQHLHKEKELINLQKKIQHQINEKITKQQREFFLKEQLKAIKQELGMDVDEKTSDYNRFKESLEKFELEGEVKEKSFSELDKLSATDSHSPEYSVIRNYLEIIIALPWNVFSDDRIDIDNSEKILNRDHYGLEEVKKRICEFLAVRQLKKNSHGSILCLVGPPGVGKTSLGKSIAAAMGRKFFRFSLGGMRDEAEIKGHRRTYIGAMPGKIIEALKIVKVKNPVIMLDEIDKLGKSFQGDPSSALLEVLDPEQNAAFRDHYLDIPFDLSDVFFITTANTVDTIPSPLLDRMEVIRLSGYIAEEKYNIAAKYLVPRAIENGGLENKFISFDKKSLLAIANDYAREAGVRSLEKQINKIIRKVAFKVVKKEIKKPLHITASNLKDFLGEPLFKREKVKKFEVPGLAVGLAWTSLGGEILTIECISNPGKGAFKLTGKLGEVMSESANIAFSYSKKISIDEGIDYKYYDKNMFHLHVPAGATPKDGPSAGITMASAMLSLFLNKIIRPNLAMTGELSLTGNVLPIGGLKEKIIAAKKSGVKEIIFPSKNKSDLTEIPCHIKKGITFYAVDLMSEVKKIIFTKGKVEFHDIIKCT